MQKYGSAFALIKLTLVICYNLLRCSEYVTPNLKVQMLRIILLMEYLKV